MSKAFLRESDFEEIPEPPRLAAALPFGVKNYLTASGADLLRQELTHLTDIDRPPLAADSTSVDSRHALKVLDQRIRHLQEALRTAEVVPSDTGERDVVRFGANVTIREPDGTVSHYRIVGAVEADAARNRISWQSPLARTLLQTRRGQRVAFNAPRGNVELEIVGIDYE